MEIVVTGPSGKLGGALVRLWQGEHIVHALGREVLDLRKPNELVRALENYSFDAIVNGAAMANPERCENNPEEARLVNTESPAALARICGERGARLVHFSTDYVLDGSREGLKDEEAPVHPLNEYGRSKLAGENLVLEEHAESIVCRVSWIFGTEPGGFLESFLARAGRGEELQAVEDKFSKPTCVREIARVVLALLERGDLKGLFHLTHEGAPESWWSYASKVLGFAHALGLLEELKEVRRQKMADATRLQVARPIHTAMDPARLRAELGGGGGSWQEAARARVRELLE
jgi:dTDP-4-dehydrorhamnose reductase